MIPMQSHEARLSKMHDTPLCRDAFMFLSMNQNLLKETCCMCSWGLQNITCTFSFGFSFQLWLTSALSAHKMYAHASWGSSQAFYTQILILQMAKYPKSQSEPSCFFFFVGFPLPPPPHHHPINKDHISLRLYSSKRHELESFGQVLH